MNAYSVEFFSKCPNNGIRIKYGLRIETRQVIAVEQLVSVVEDLEEGYHEELADQLSQQFPGRQVLIADHHGVTIETTRGSAE